MKIDIVKNAKRNLIFGTANRLILLLCPFVERHVIQSVLGSEYLGLGSLYTSVISVLSLSELGFSSAMVYNMYQPAAQGDTRKMNALLHFYRSVYRIVGVVIVAVGLLLIPLLPRLINGSHPADIGLTELYLIYLGNTAVSYFLYAYRTSIIVVHQRDDINSAVNSAVKIALTAAQIAALLLTRNYYLFALLMPLFTVVNNLLVGWRTRVLFPQYRPQGSLTREDRAAIRKLVTGTFIQNVCGVTRNSLDSICISAFLGLTMNAIYNNYYLIILGITAFMTLITSSFMGGIGNHVATRSAAENFQEMKRLDFVYLWLGGWCMICLLCLYQPFMRLWMGEDMMLPFSAVVLLCLYFYLLKLGDVRLMYTSARGLWWEQRYRALAETGLNLLLNITLGRLLGVHGIILATMISLFLCNYLWSVAITFRLYFDLSRRREYYAYQGRQSLLTGGAAVLTYCLCVWLPVSSPFLQLLVRGAICVVVPNGIFYLVYRHSEQFRYAIRNLKP